MAGLLGEIFSAGNVARRKLTDLLGNPMLSAQQYIGNINDKARALNELTAAAAQEGVNYGPASQQLGGLLAEGYNPVGMVANKRFQTVVNDASEIFGQGAKRIKYTDPNSGGMIDILQKPDGTASILGLEVPEAMRGQGIGQSLQSQAMQDFPEMMGQVSSKAAAKTAYRLGRRPPNQPEATLDDVYKIMDEYSSVNLVSPDMQKRFMQSLLD
jgi:ribosomal protein S18 acetylase RimI-like enzyme